VRASTFNLHTIRELIMGTFFKILLTGALAYGGYFFYAESFAVEPVTPETVFDDWYYGEEGYIEARAEAAETGDPILLYFYTDW